MVFIMALTLVISGLFVLLGVAAIKAQQAEIAIVSIVMAIVILIGGGIATIIEHNSNIKRNQYNYQIQYNNTTYYTNDYILSNGGIEFEAEEGHFILPVEGQELKINKTKKGGHYWSPFYLQFAWRVHGRLSEPRLLRRFFGY